MNENYVKKFGLGGIDLPERNTWCALHHAIVEGHIKVVDKLLELGANVEKTLGNRARSF